MTNVIMLRKSYAELFFLEWVETPNMLWKLSKQVATHDNI